MVIQIYKNLYMDMWLVPVFLVLGFVFWASLRWGKDPTLEILSGIDKKTDLIIDKLTSK